MNSIQKSVSKKYRLGAGRKPLAKPIDPDQAERLLARGEKRTFAPAVQASRNGEEVHGGLKDLLVQAKRERLEFLAPAIETMQMALALDRAQSGAPPGTLTVKGWISLLNSWDKQVEQMAFRQVRFARAFIAETQDRLEGERSPLAPMVRELLLQLEQAERDGAGQREQAVA